jgi:UDP-3-O-[3-hydroxymyristoyl] glucosamine N-acyltransferase
MLTLAALAELVGGDIVGDATLTIEDISDLQSAGPKHISFFANPKYKLQVAQTRASAVLACEPVEGASCAFILCREPYVALAQVAQALHPQTAPAPGIHPKAILDPSAIVDPTAVVDAGAVVAAQARIGARSRIGSGAYVGAHVSIGDDVLLHPNVTVLDRCSIGHRVILHSGTVIGADGFGYAEDKRGVRHKIPQVGIVEIHDDVEIGANTTVDRATFGKTTIGAGSKIDNLVQIGHNVSLGEHCVVVAQSGISGSTQLGNAVVMGAQTGTVGHIQIASGVMMAARGGATHSLHKPGLYSGYPATEHKIWLKAAAAQYELPNLRRRVRALEQQLVETKRVINANPPDCDCKQRGKY